MLVVKVFVGAYSVVGKRLESERLESERLESDQVRQLVQSLDEDRRCPAFLQRYSSLSLGRPGGMTTRGVMASSSYVLSSGLPGWFLYHQCPSLPPPSQVFPHQTPGDGTT